MANTIQTYGGFVVLRKSINSLKFIAQWLSYAQDGRLILDEPSGLNLKQNYHDFNHSRNDQSIVSLLSKRWQILIWPNPRFGPQLTNGTFYKPFREIDTTKFKPKWPLVAV